MTESPSPTADRPEQPIRCDLCGYHFKDADTCFTYVTPSTGTLEEAKRGEAYWFADEEWAVCLRCHMALYTAYSGVTTEVEAVLAILQEWRTHNMIVVLPPNPEEEQRLKEAAFQNAVTGLQAFFACVVYPPNYPHIEVQIVEKENPDGAGQDQS